MRFLKRMSVKARAIVAWPTLFLCAFTALVTPVSKAEARRYHVRERYAPLASAMAIDFYSGRILYSKNANEPRYPASVTKVMTLYLLFDALRDGKLTMQTKLRVSEHAADQSPTKLGLDAGDTITVADAIGAIVTKSANDMAVTIAEALAGSEEEFARRMTQKARTIGMLNTTFRNASGLPNPDQKTTAQDLIVLGKNIITDHPERSKVFATRYFQYNGEIYRNHNTLLFSYEGMEGMKTGFTTASGFNLLATARRGDKRLLAVVLGGHSSGARNAAMRNILDDSWSKALTLTAARKAGLPQTTALKPKAAEPAPPAKPKPVEQAAAVAKPKPAERAPAAEKTHKEEIAEARPASSAHSAAPIRETSLIGRKPDRTSISMIIASIETGLAARQKAARAGQSAPPPMEATTDEPEETAERAVSHSADYSPPPVRDIARSELWVARSQPAVAVHNVSVHYKTARAAPIEVEPLAAVAVDPLPEPQPARVARASLPVEREEPAERPKTLAAATAAVSREMDQPGPYHVQVGAFPDQAQAEERLESVKQALDPGLLKQHPQFIMPVALPTGVTMFRARLSRFASEAQAKSACKQLKRSGIECWDIRAQ